MYKQLCSWENLRTAYQKAAKGKRGRQAAAAFEYNLADNLLALQAELQAKSYQPGAYTSFYIHDPKKRLISEGFPFLGFVIYPTHRRLKRRKAIAFRRKLKNEAQPCR